MIQILVAVILLIVFLFAFGLAFYYFIQLERQYRKRKLIQKLPKLASFNKTGETARTSSICDTSLESAHTITKTNLAENEVKVATDPKETTNKLDDTNKLKIPDIKYKIKFSESSAITASAALKTESGKLSETDNKNEIKNDEKAGLPTKPPSENSLKRKALPTINYTELAKLPKSLLNQSKTGGLYSKYRIYTVYT